MKQEISCPVCGSKSLTAATHSHELMHAGQQVSVAELEHYDCATCGADPIFPEQIRRNEKRIADAKKQAQGLLTADEVLAIREGLGLSQAEAAQLFGGGANAFSKYERGEVLQSVPMDRLLRVAEAMPYVVTFLRQACGLAAKPAVPLQGALTLDAVLAHSRVFTVGMGGVGAKYLSHVVGNVGGSLPVANIQSMEDYNVDLVVSAVDVIRSVTRKVPVTKEPLVTMLPMNSLPA